MKKYIKKISAIVLIIAIVCTLPLYYAFGQETTIRTVPLLQEGNFDVPKTNTNKVSFYGLGNRQSLQDLIYDELMKGSESININTFLYKFTIDEIDDIYCNVINDHPELFYVTSSFYSNFDKLTNYVNSIGPIYAMPYNEIEQAKIVFNNGVDKAMSVIDNTMNDMQKALVLHDYVCNNATYNRPGDIAHSAYGFFKDGNVVCAGYSLAYSYLLNKAGVQCENMISSAMQHAWNVVKINGNWYHVDLTYDDVCYFNKGENIYGAMQHKMFLKSDAYFKSLDGNFHYGFSTYDNAIASDTSLDNYFWHDVNTVIPVINGDYYYLDEEPSKYLYLKKRDISGNESYVNKNIKFSSPSLTLNSNAVDPNGTSHPKESKDVLIRMTYLDDRFYIAYNNNLKSVFLNGDNYDITTLTNYPVGLGVRNGNLVYQPYQTYTPIILDKNTYLNDYLMNNKSSSYNNYPDLVYDKVINTKDFAKHYNNNYVY